MDPPFCFSKILLQIRNQQPRKFLDTIFHPIIPTPSYFGHKKSIWKHCALGEKYLLQRLRKPRHCAAFFALFGLVWTSMDLSGHVWTCLDLSGFVWTCLNLSGNVLACLDVSGHILGMPTFNWNYRHYMKFSI